MAEAIEVPADAESERDFVTLIGSITNYIQNERVRAYNEGVDAERERCAKLVETFPAEIIQLWDRPGGPPGNGKRPATFKDAADWIRHPDEQIEGTK